MHITFIIAHYDPGTNTDCRQSFLRTLDAIHAQKDDFDVEIIVADDGSKYEDDFSTFSTKTLDQNGRTIHHLKEDELHTWLKKEDYNFPEISHWLYLPKDKPCMSKARVLNAAISLAKSDLLFFLDDDNYFISEDSIKHIIQLYEKYSLIIGQIKDGNGRFRPYNSHRVQGTTIGIKKSIMENIGGFGEWTEDISCGVDSDLFLKLYDTFSRDTDLKACYTSQIQTVDSLSKRWRPFIPTFFRNRQARRAFQHEYDCKNYRSVRHNPSRDKFRWVENLVSAQD
ncbi:MAG: glycosyltransferase [Candidatus Marinimicrobia bacterium]|nr:glycosyltransferase [Candidatus Neomarinimicrobiota bacterium]